MHLGLSSFPFQLNSGSGCPLQVRRKANAHNLQRAFHFHPAAHQHLNIY